MKDSGHCPFCGKHPSERDALWTKDGKLIGTKRLTTLHHSEYNSWHGMIRRCYTTTDSRYESYGGRGIKVCDRWKKSFRNFLEDMGQKPDIKSERISLDRIDNDGDYEPSNCRWATNSQQILNTRKRRGSTSKYRGVSWDKQGGRWHAAISLLGDITYLGRFINEEDAARAYNKAAIVLHKDFAQLNDVPNQTNAGGVYE